jgi:hypothetical protein
MVINPILFDSQLGTLPKNGTVCKTDHTGFNNLFIQQFSEFETVYYIGDSGNSKMRLGLGLGLGLGFPLLVVLIILCGFWNIRRKGKKLDVPHSHPKYVARNKPREWRNTLEDRESIVLEDFKNKSTFPESGEN